MSNIDWFLVSVGLIVLAAGVALWRQWRNPHQRHEGPDGRRLGCPMEVTTQEYADRLMKQRDHYRRLANGYREALAELAGSIPMDNYMRMVGSDHPLAQALAQANLVVQEGPQ